MKILTARYISVRLLQKKKLRLEISKYSKDNWQRTLSEIVHKYSNKRFLGKKLPNERLFGQQFVYYSLKF